MKEIFIDLSFLDEIIENKNFYLNFLKALFIYICLLLFIFKLIPNNSSGKNILTWNNVQRDFVFLLNKYKYLIDDEKNIDSNSPIWMMWYQGIENAPPIVLSCFRSVIKNRANHKVYIISKYNLNKYIKLPSYIMKKFDEGVFSITHFSDIVRMALLSKYGGYWIDSTYFVTSPLIHINTTFYTLKLNYCWIKDHPFINCLWSGNFMAVPKNSFIATYGYNAFLLYWKKYNSLIDYLLIDYIIYIAYNKLEKFKKVINELPFVPCNIFSLVQILDSKYEKTDLKCFANKLTKEGLWYKYNGQNRTNYGYIIEKYKFKYKKENITFFLK